MADSNLEKEFDFEAETRDVQMEKPRQSIMRRLGLERLESLSLIPLALLVPTPARESQYTSEASMQTELVQEQPELDSSISKKHELKQAENYVLEFLKWFSDKSVGTMITVAVEEMLKRHEKQATKSQKENNKSSATSVLEALDCLKSTPQDKEAKSRFCEIFCIYLSGDSSATNELKQLLALAPYKQFEAVPLGPPISCFSPPIICSASEKLRQPLASFDAVFLPPSVKYDSWEVRPAAPIIALPKHIRTYSRGVV